MMWEEDTGPNDGADASGIPDDFNNSLHHGTIGDLSMSFDVKAAECSLDIQGTLSLEGNYFSEHSSVHVFYTLKTHVQKDFKP